MDTIQQEYKELYTSEVPPNPSIQTYVQCNILDNAPHEDKIVQALQKMKRQYKPGSSRISAEQIRNWHSKASTSEDKISYPTTTLFQNKDNLLDLSRHREEFDRGILYPQHHLISC
jgi:hypothetical protein